MEERDRHLARARATLERVVACARSALGPDLRSVVLFGSAAEDRLRATSDINVIIVLHRFDPAAVDLMRDELRLARTAVRLDPMFLLTSEIEDASAAFAVKFDDVRRRRRTLYGDDPFDALQIDRHAIRRRTEQVLLNLELRVRRAYALDGDRDELATRTLAEAAGPLRAAAAAVLELRGAPVASGRDALAMFAAELEDHDLVALPGRISAARENSVPLPVAGQALLSVGRMCAQLRSALRTTG